MSPQIRKHLKLLVTFSSSTFSLTLKQIYVCKGDAGAAALAKSTIDRVSTRSWAELTHYDAVKIFNKVSPILLSVRHL